MLKKLKDFKLKRFILLSVLLFATASLTFGAAPANNSAINTAIASQVIDSQWTGTVWSMVDSMIVAKTDSCYTYYSFTGSATLYPGQKLYLGISGNGTTITIPAIYSTYEWSAKEPYSRVVKFGVNYLDSLISQTDASDTVVVWSAVKGSSSSEKVAVSGQLVGTVVDID